MTTYDCILAIVEYKSVTKAAEHLYMTQPALTMKVKREENRLGVKLFEPNNRVKLTKEGEMYVREMRKILSQENALYDALRTMSKRDQRQALVMGIGFNRGKYWLPTLLPYLMERNPDIDFQIQEATDGKIEDMIKTGQIDFGIMASPIISSSVAVTPLGSETLFLAIPHNDCLIRGLQVPESGGPSDVYLEPARLNGRTIILGNNSYGINKLFNTLVARFNLRFASLINVGNTDTAYLLAARGLGITPTFMSTCKIALPFADMQRPVMCRLQDCTLSRQVVLAYKSSSRMESRIQEISAQIADCVVTHRLTC